jgi:DNA-3-methyladenine glycosylase II
VALCYDPNKAIQTLSKADKKLGQLIKTVGRLDIDPPARLNPFEALLRSIVYQQLSGKAAATIHGRVKSLFTGRTIKPIDVINTPEEMLRGAGMSRAKVAAVKDLAQKTVEGLVPSGLQLRKMSDEEIVARLTQVRGIGEWTVQMVLMFQLGRPDVLPVKDLGVRKGFKITYNLKDMPTEKEMFDYCECWRPFRSVASWYMWRAVDLANEK